MDKVAKNTFNSKTSWSSAVKGTASTTIFGVDPATATTCASAASAAKNEAADSGWVTATKTTCKKAVDPIKVPSTKKAALAQNKFFLPKNLEKKLHCPTPFASQPKTITAEAYGAKKDSDRCFKRNQRRSQQRAQKRAEREAQLKKAAETKASGDGPTNAAGVPTSNSLDANPKSTTVSVTSIICLPTDVLVSNLLSFLSPKDLVAFGRCCKYTKEVSEEGYLWRASFRRDFPTTTLTPTCTQEWKLTYKLTLTQGIDRLRCFHTKVTFLSDVLGAGIDYTVNPKTNLVDYIRLSQDLLSETAFRQHRVRADVFGNKFDLFLPLYFSEEHFQRALPQIRRTIVRLCPEYKTTRFDPMMALDVFPKLMNTFVVLLADEGISASRKSFNGFIRIHRLFLALTNEYPSIKLEALRRLHMFAYKESMRLKSSCQSLGDLIPLIMIVDRNEYRWAQLAPSYLEEFFDRSVLWACKKFPQLDRTHSPTGKVESEDAADERVRLTREATIVGRRLLMFNVYFLERFCQRSAAKSARVYDGCLGDALDGDSHPLSFSRFREGVNHILLVATWKQYFRLLGAPCPPTKEAMARKLRQHVQNSRRKGYHQAGMDFSRVHASGTSKILAKGQEYSASSGLRRAVFTDSWGFMGGTKYLDATCLLYRGKALAETIDYMNRQSRNTAVQHSGDVMREDGGTHTININLQAMDPSVTSCVFVISAWADATLADIISPSISFADADADADAEAKSGSAPPLCTYDLDAHDKISHLTSVIMCKLYRARNGGWHVLAIGDAHRGAADNYAPIYKAVQKLL